MKIDCGGLIISDVICATLTPLQRSGEILHFSAQFLTTIRSHRARPAVIYNDLVKDDFPAPATAQTPLRRSGPTGRSSVTPMPRARPDTPICIFRWAALRAYRHYSCSERSYAHFLRTFFAHLICPFSGRLSGRSERPSHQRRLSCPSERPGVITTISSQTTCRCQPAPNLPGCLAA